MKHKIFCIMFIFGVSLVYLHQKVMIFTQAYALNESRSSYNKLVDCRDQLLYNFSKRSSLSEINSWVESNGFEFGKENTVLALDMDDTVTTASSHRKNIFTASLSQIFRLPIASRALAGEQRAVNNY